MARPDTIAAGGARTQTEDDLWYAGTPLTTSLQRWARQTPHAPAFEHIDYSADRHGRATLLTWSQVDRRARAVAAELRAVALPGERAALLAPQSLDYVVGFLGALYAGVVAVPLFAPGHAGHCDRLVGAIADADARVWLTTAARLADVRALVDGQGAPRPRHVLPIDAVPAARADEFAPTRPDGDDVAYLQYTSGSTRTPAGAVITHRNVAANARQALSVLGAPAGGPATMVGWLPLYHDMGLVLSVAAPLAGGLRSVFTDPFAFVQRPSRWLRMLADHPNTISAGPDFAFEHCLSRVGPDERAALDLSGVHAVVNGSEPIRARTLTRFAEAFGRLGLRPQALRPAYGLAEATVLVTMSAPGAAPTVAAFDRAALGAGRARPVGADDERAVLSVGCGRPAGQRVLIVDPTTHAPVPAGQVGEVWVRGVNVAAGYWGERAGDAVAFDARPAHDDLDAGDVGGWLRTGDLGVLHEGELHVTGRIKDLIIVDGRNHYPQDIEATVRDAHPAVRGGRVAAFPLSAEADDGVVVVAEYARRLPAAERDPEGVAIAVRGAVSRRHELRVRDVVLTPVGSVPRTSSGKVARAACRARYLTGGFAPRVDEARI